MGGDLIPWVVGITLGVAVIVVGLRRDLGSVTRNWLPDFEKGTATAESVDGGRGRKPLSPRQRLLTIWFYSLIGLFNVILLVVSADDRAPHAVSALVFGFGAVVLTLKRERDAEVPES